MSLSGALFVLALALLPSTLFGIYNTGHQANVLMAEAGMTAAPGWHDIPISLLGSGYDPASTGASIVHGLTIYLPVLATALMVAAFWETLFVRLRGGGFRGEWPVIGLLFSLIVPPAVPIWQVALGLTFGVVVGKEIFGGTGRNFLNPVLTALAFLYVTYPADMLGETAWAVHGLSGATPMQTAPLGDNPFEAASDDSWLMCFLGLVPGAMGATSPLACMLGACLLIYTRIASVRIMAGVLVGMIAASLLANQIGDPADSYAMMSWHWHLVLGSFAFGTIFLATDPASAAMTNTGRWIYGMLVGAVIVLIRVANSTHPDGVMFAVLFGNILAPTIDYVVIAANIRRRRKRNG